MTPDQCKSAYRRALAIAGEPVAIRRYTGTGQNRPYFDAEVRARVTDFEPHELVGGIVQGDRKLVALAEDLERAQFPLPLKKGDKAIVRGRELSIEAPDDNTRRVQGVLVAIEMQVRG